MNSHLNNAFTNELEPTVFYLGQNYPNPFNEKTKIKFCIAATTRVTLTVYNAEGEEIEKLVDEEKDPGTYEVDFSICHSRESLPDGKAGGNLPAGRKGQKSRVYFYRLEAGEYKSQKQMILIK